MSELIKIVQKTFEQIKIEDETGFEFWSARDLMKALGYSQWRRFSGVIEKAKIACENSLDIRTFKKYMSRVKLEDLIELKKFI